MNIYSVFLVLALLLPGCTEKKDASLALIDVKNQQWTTFEGKIPSPDGDIMEVELSLLEASPGVPSFYRLNSVLINNRHAWVAASEGQYEVTALGNNEFGITLLEVATGHPISTGAYFKRNIDRMRKVPSVRPPLNKTDFYFTTTGDGILVNSDDHFIRISNDERFSIHKRSDLFTVEGYVTVNPDCKMEFFERNTLEDWQVAQLGAYGTIEERYNYLASEPWEGIYIRALAYSIPDTTDASGRASSLVVKKLIAMGRR